MTEAGKDAAQASSEQAELSRLREGIDRIDDEVLRLVSERRASRTGLAKSSRASSTGPNARPRSCAAWPKPTRPPARRSRAAYRA